MAQMCLVWNWWSRSNKRGGENESSNINSDCCSSSAGCLAKLVKRLKKQGRIILRPSGQSSFQCRYDPLSYSLNFDTTSGVGSLSDDVDYYQFCAFSSKFVANQRILSTTSH
ncbi:hypothetical protein HS088_TW16G00013 [Tripterygium wilfordii]|uniref:Uncharacterized protein n=1 Tax=Tripterygium wilfordii TaxID=458696 RepID=A0A7J7CHN4_TRIWF|nr:hypothetical protein HS088_TW16G00013 [Tripterygium wilfordii]